MKREQLVGAILEFLSGYDLLTLEDIRSALEDEIDRAGPEALVDLRERLSIDRGWDYYPPDPLARRIHHVLAHRFLQRDSRVAGVEHLKNLDSARVVIFSNHLSYADANVVDVLLQRCGADVLARRLTALAGPKVFTSQQRRFSSLCFGTVKVPQSTEVASGEAMLSQREVARAARRSIDVACSRLVEGDALLLFGEGTRSRSGAMQPMLLGAARYLETDGTWVLPVGVTGPELLFPIDAPTVRPARVSMQLGKPIRARALIEASTGNRRLMVDAIGLAIADLLPARCRGTYAGGAALDRARRILAAAQDEGASR
jgi:1-acyl-sn-glycerol-3-phosphate acyltransferase